MMIMVPLTLSLLGPVGIWKGDDEAIISIYRQGAAEGTFVDNGNGELTFTSDVIAFQSFYCSENDKTLFLLS